MHKIYTCVCVRDLGANVHACDDLKQSALSTNYKIMFCIIILYPKRNKGIMAIR